MLYFAVRRKKCCSQILLTCYAHVLLAHEHNGLTVSAKLHQNLCSRKWLKSNLSLLRSLDPCGSYSSWGFHKPCFSRKHIFHESYRVNRTQDYELTQKQVLYSGVLMLIFYIWVKKIYFLTFFPQFIAFNIFYKMPPSITVIIMESHLWNNTSNIQ